jgi:hypothetical protein
LNIVDALDDPNVFPGVMQGSTWAPWRAALRAMFGLPLAEHERELFTRCTGRTSPPGRQVAEFWAVCGRRAGKTYALSVVACWLALFRDYRPHKRPGELVTVLLVAGDRVQARTAFRYVKAILRGSAMLERQIVRETAEEIELASGVLIEVASNSYRLIRGRTIAALLADEVAFWHADGLNPADEVLVAARPAMLSIPDSLLMVASTPYARRGPVWEAYRRSFGRDDPNVLVWSAPSRVMNPGLSERLIERAYEDDPASAAAEYGASFRADVQGFVDRTAVMACVMEGCRERPRVAGAEYHGFCDPSGGRGDAMALAVAHKEPDGTAMLDCVRVVKPPFVPASVTAEFAATLRSYGLATCTGDRFAGEWVAAEFRKHGVAYEPAPKAKGAYYVELLPMINSGQVALLDLAILVNQLCSLERRVGRGARGDVVDHPPMQHDDVCNAAAGALVMAAEVRKRLPYVW